MPLTITDNPSDWFGENGGTATFSCAATSSTPPITYQWERSLNGGAYQDIVDGNLPGGIVASGATTDTLTLDNVKVNNESQNYTFRCQVSDALPATETTTAAQVYIELQPPLGYDYVLGVGDNLGQTLIGFRSERSDPDEFGEFVPDEIPFAFINGFYTPSSADPLVTIELAAKAGRYVFPDTILADIEGFGEVKFELQDPNEDGIYTTSEAGLSDYLNSQLGELVGINLRYPSKSGGLGGYTQSYTQDYARAYATPLEK